jgi:hypothetical protein
VRRGLWGNAYRLSCVTWQLRALTGYSHGVSAITQSTLSGTRLNSSRRRETDIRFHHRRKLHD